MKTIQYRFNILKNKIKFFFAKILESAKKVFNKDFFKSINKKTVFTITGIWLLATISTTLSAAITSHTPINRSQSIAELIYNNGNGDTIGFLTPYETSKNTYTLCSVQPEKSAKFRNVNSTAELYDCYPANYLNTTPATVDYIDEEKVNISFILIPKENYTNSYFSAPHTFNLLVGNTSSSSNLEDIYINKKYADKLISDDSTIESYKQLLDKKITLPYTNSYVKNIDIEYVIKGVIDDDAKYQRYKSFVGDFFLANQYLNLPINGTCLFELPKKIDEIREMMDSLFKIYEYDTIGRYFNALSFTLAYEYRIYEIEAIGPNQNDMFKINDGSNTFFNKYNSIYDYYFTKSYIMPLILISLSLLSLLIIFITMLRTIYKFGATKKITISVLFSILFAFPTAIGTNYIYKALFLNGISVSISSWQTFVFMLLPIILMIAIWLIYRKFQKSA